MWQSLGDRIRFWAAVVRLLAWKWLVIVPLAALGIFQAIREEFLPPEQQEQLRLLPFLPNWPWEWWALSFLIALFVFAMEGAFRLSGRISGIRADIDAQDAFDLILLRSRWAKKHEREWEKLPRVMYETGRSQLDVIEDRIQSELQRQFPKLLRRGDIICWGSESPNASSIHLTPEKQIDADKWDHIEISYSHRPWNCARYSVGHRRGELAFVGLRFCRRQILQHFPKAWCPR